MSGDNTQIMKMIWKLKGNLIVASIILIGVCGSDKTFWNLGLCLTRGSWKAVCCFGRFDVKCLSAAAEADLNHQTRHTHTHTHQNLEKSYGHFASFHSAHREGDLRLCTFYLLFCFIAFTFTIYMFLIWIGNEVLFYVHNIRVKRSPFYASSTMMWFNPWLFYVFRIMSI